MASANDTISATPHQPPCVFTETISAKDRHVHTCAFYVSPPPAAVSANTRCATAKARFAAGTPA